MKKSIIAVCVLVFLIVLEALALYVKSKNSEPMAFALDEKEFALPERAIKVSPLVFETDFVEIADTALDAAQSVLENSFARHLALTFTRETRQRELEKTQKQIQQQRLDAFRKAMADNPVEIRGTYLGGNACEVDGIQGICANGVYRLGEYCVACYDGLCAGAKCPPQKAQAEEIAGGGTDNNTEIAATDGKSLEPEVVAKAESYEETPVKEISVADTPAEIAPENATVPNEAESAAENVAELQEGQPETPAAEDGISGEEEDSVSAETKAEVKSENEPQKQGNEATAQVAKKAEKNTKDEAKKIAVVIDDVGLSVPFTNQIARIGKPITVSFLPYGASNKAQVQKLRSAGLEVMLHVPMMPHIPADLAPVTLSPKMSKKEIQQKFVAMLERFSSTGMGGVNNHMGSAFTENREAMSAVAEILKERNLFFLDSVTTSKSVGRSVCKQYGVPYAARDVFLDNERNHDYIMGQFHATERVAAKKGYAIAIGHPYPQTLEALQTWLQEIEDKNIEIVPISVLIDQLNPK